MKVKKLITGMLVIVILLLQFSFVQFNNYVYANTQEVGSQNSENITTNNLHKKQKIYIMQCAKCTLKEF